MSLALAFERNGALPIKSKNQMVLEKTYIHLFRGFTVTGQVKRLQKHLK